MLTLDPRTIGLLVNQDCRERIAAASQRKKLPMKPAEVLFAEIKDYLRENRLNRFVFSGYCNEDLSRLDELCSLVIAERLSLDWTGSAIVDPKMSDELIRKMKRAGCSKLVFDVLGGSDAFLERAEARFSSNDASRLLRACHREGILVGVAIVVGHPREKQSEYAATLAFLREHRDCIAEISQLTYCLSRFFVCQSLSHPLCSSWKQCLAGIEKSGIRSRPLPSDVLSDIKALGIPLVEVRPPEEILRALVSDHPSDRGLSPSLIEKGPLALFHLNDGLQIQWREAVLTRSAGLNVALRCGGRWIDTTKADWRIIEIRPDHLAIRASFRDIPAVQDWSLTLDDASGIDWQVSMELREQLPIEEYRVVMIIDRDYDEWSAGGERGKFAESSEEWRDLCSGAKAASAVGVGVAGMHQGLPRCTLEAKTGMFYPVVQETPAEIGGYIIGLRRSVSNGGMAAGRHDLFAGRILIEKGVRES